MAHKIARFGWLPDLPDQRVAHTLSQMRGCLADGYPFVFGFTVYESFESAAVSKTGKVNMPKQSEKQVGGHAVMAGAIMTKPNASLDATVGVKVGVEGKFYDAVWVSAQG